ncbi:MAG: cytidylate kinase-like family protein [Eubacterium sp.]|nr:cytidylate kinase-like family protein [Eubacterium sp.]
MGNKIVTIGRQFGSNGRIIGQRVAEKLGIVCYDKELIKVAAKESGLWEDLLENLDEKPTNSFLYSVVMDPYSFAYSVDNSNYGMNLNQKAFMATFNTIRKIADEKSCVFIGRCADYVLRDYENVLNVFIYAPLEDRIKNIIERYPDMTEKKAKDQIVKEDKARASYYNFYTSNKWGRIESYDICINSSKVGVETAADMIIDTLKSW